MLPPPSDEMDIRGGEIPETFKLSEMSAPPKLSGAKKRRMRKKKAMLAQDEPQIDVDSSRLDISEPLSPPSTGELPDNQAHLSALGAMPQEIVNPHTMSSAGAGYEMPVKDQNGLDSEFAQRLGGLGEGLGWATMALESPMMLAALSKVGSRGMQYFSKRAPQVAEDVAPMLEETQIAPTRISQNNLRFGPAENANALNLQQIDDVPISQLRSPPGELDPGRVDALRSRAAGGQEIGAPHVGVTTDDQLELINGRHRLELARQQGLRQVPINVSPEEVAPVNNLLGRDKTYVFPSDPALLENQPVMLGGSGGQMEPPPLNPSMGESFVPLRDAKPRGVGGEMGFNKQSGGLPGDAMETTFLPPERERMSYDAIKREVLGNPMQQTTADLRPPPMEELGEPPSLPDEYMEPSIGEWSGDQVALPAPYDGEHPVLGGALDETPDAASFNRQSDSDRLRMLRRAAIGAGAAGLGAAGVGLALAHTGGEGQAAEMNQQPAPSPYARQLPQPKTFKQTRYVPKRKR